MCVLHVGRKERAAVRIRLGECVGFCWCLNGACTNFIAKLYADGRITDAEVEEAAKTASSSLRHFGATTLRRIERGWPPLLTDG